MWQLILWHFKKIDTVKIQDLLSTINKYSATISHIIHTEITWLILSHQQVTEVAMPKCLSTHIFLYCVMSWTSLEKAKTTTEQWSNAGNPPIAPACPTIEDKLQFALLFSRRPCSLWSQGGLPYSWWWYCFGRLLHHMKIKACDQLFPNQPVVDNNSFDMTFSIACHVLIALSLTSAADYAHLLTNALKIKKKPTVKVSLTSHALNLVCELWTCIYVVIW